MLVVIVVMDEAINANDSGEHNVNGNTFKDWLNHKEKNKAHYRNCGFSAIIVLYFIAFIISYI